MEKFLFSGSKRTNADIAETSGPEGFGRNNFSPKTPRNKESHRETSLSSSCPDIRRVPELDQDTSSETSETPKYIRQIQILSESLLVPPVSQHPFPTLLPIEGEHYDLMNEKFEDHHTSMFYSDLVTKLKAQPSEVLHINQPTTANQPIYASLQRQSTLPLQNLSGKTSMEFNIPGRPRKGFMCSQSHPPDDNSPLKLERPQLLVPNAETDGTKPDIGLPDFLLFQQPYRYQRKAYSKENRFAFQNTITLIPSGVSCRNPSLY